MVVSDFIHPDDSAAMQSLQSIPILPMVMNKVFEMGLDDVLWSENITTNLRLSEHQMPEIYRLLPPICKSIGIPEPELYLSSSILPNSWTSGKARTYIVLTYGLIRRLSEDELKAVIAHECGHIICNHVVYNTLAEGMFSFGEFISENIVGGNIISSVALKGIRQKLAAWQRASELSADRVACMVASADSLIRALAKIERIPYHARKNMDYNAWAQQGADYEALKNGKVWNKIVRWMANADLDHPYSPVRAFEAIQWEASRYYTRAISGNTCPSCGAVVEPSWKFCKKCGSKIDISTRVLPSPSIGLPTLNNK